MEAIPLRRGGFRRSHAKDDRLGRLRLLSSDPENSIHFFNANSVCRGRFRYSFAALFLTEPGPMLLPCSLLHIFRCRKYLKKTLNSAQNLENKRSEIFLPARSMVLKEVRGKILETLELAWCPIACGSILGLR